MNDASSTGRLATRGSLFVLMALIVLAPTAFWVGVDPFESIKSLLLHAAGLILLLIAALAPRRAFPRDFLSYAVAGVGLAAALATATSIDPLRSLLGAYRSNAGLLTTLGYVAVYFAARAAVDSPSRLTQLLTALGVACAVVAGYGLLQVGGADPFRWELRSDFAGWVRPTSTLGHPMQLGGFLAASLPLVLWLTVKAETPRQRALFALTAAAMTVVLLLTLARGAWLGAAAGLLVFAALRGRASLRWLIGICLLVGVTVALLPAARERLTGLLHSPARVEAWRACWALFLQRPLTGHGPESLPLIYGRELQPAYWEAEWRNIPWRAHNELLDVLVTQGVLGGLAALALVAALLYATARAWRVEANRPLVAALAASVVACLVQLMTGFSTVACLVPFAACCGLLSRLAASPLTPQPEPDFRVPWPGWAASLTIAATLFAAWAVVVRPAQSWWLSAAALRAETPAALSWAAEAAALSPEREECWMFLGATAERLAEGAEADQRLRLLRRAVAAAERASQVSPHNPEHHANLGRARLLLARAGEGALTDVLAPTERALERSPRNAVYLLDAVRACLALGDLDQAERYLDRAERTGMRHAILTAERGAIRLMQRRNKEAAGLLHEALKGRWQDDVDGMNRTRGMIGLLSLDLGRPAAALEYADEMNKQRPEWPATHWIRAQALERLGRREEAEEAYQQVLRRRPGHPQAREALARLRR